MNKHTIISAIAIVAISFPILYGVWGVYSVEQLQLRTEKDQFSYFDFSNYQKIKACNPMPFFLSFSEINIDVHYLNDLKAEFQIGPMTMSPNTSKILDIDFSSENVSEAQYLFMHMDGQFYGEVPIRLNPQEMKVSTTYQTKIVGLIPYQKTITQSGLEFTQMMNENTSCENID